MAAVSLSPATESNPATGIKPANKPAGLDIDVSDIAPNPALALDTAAAELQPPQAHPSNSPLSVIATNSPPLELEPFPQYPPGGISGWFMRTFARRSATKEMEDFKRRNTPSVTKGLDVVAAGSSSTSASTIRRVRFNDPTATAFFAPPTPEVPLTASVSSFDFSDEPRALVQRTPGNELNAEGNPKKEAAGKKPAGKEEKVVVGEVVSDDKKSAKNAPPPADPSDLGALMLFMMTVPFLGVGTYVGTVEAMGYAIRVTAEGRGGGLLFPPRARPAVMDVASDPRPKEKRRKRKTV